VVGKANSRIENPFRKEIIMKKVIWILGILLLVSSISTTFAQFGFRYTNLELKNLIRKNKIEQLLIPIMREYDIDCYCDKSSV